jgi:hypothetical protein
VDTNEEQTFTLDGRFKFKETMKITKPPCSPGARKDGKRGIWVKA